MFFKRLLIVLAFFCFVDTLFLNAQQIWPGEKWQKISNPQDIGWSTQKLNEAKNIADSIGSAAVMIVHRGAVLDAWGEMDRKFMCHSMRKSLLSAMIGVHVGNGSIDLSKTLSELAIDDAPNPLTDLEKTATIEQLLASRSGIYLQAAYEWPTRKPQRGKFNPGEHWFYPNNWDYNALLTIYEKETGNKLFEDFNTRIARPIGMEDYEISDGYYHFERHKSTHPAYPFRMSTRDLARFGLLFLRRGTWREQQVISKNWVEKSTSPISQTYAEGEGYGLLWWVDQKNFKYDYFSAEGTGGHGVIVVPALDLVIVHRTNTYVDQRISYRQRGKLIAKIMEAYTGPSVDQQVKLSAFETPSPKPSFPSSDEVNLQLYLGNYSIEKLFDYESTSVEVYLDSSHQLAIFIPYKGYF
ncbi:MAG: serine hydrolase, partial [Bacteroidota bacterium]